MDAEHNVKLTILLRHAPCYFSCESRLQHIVGLTDGNTILGQHLTVVFHLQLRQSIYLFHKQATHAIDILDKTLHPVGQFR